MKPLILASRSPRRALLLSQLGLTFRVLTPSVEETNVFSVTEKEIIQQTKQNAFRKAESVHKMVDEGIIISGDTVIVTQDFQVLGKPATSAEALAMLKQLVGTWHRVLSAVAVISANLAKVCVDHAWATVYFRRAPLKVLRHYITTQEPLGKAGGYAIQGKGGFLLTQITGSPSAVIGLPLELVVSLLSKHGIEIWQCWTD
jgi:septum formation protein